MNKEEIEEIKRLLFQGRLSQYGKRKLVKYLEQKESILNKVTNKLKEDIENADNNIKHMEDKTILQTIARELAIGTRDYAKEILNIIEGEKE